MAWDRLGRLLGDNNVVALALRAVVVVVVKGAVRRILANWDSAARAR